MSIDAKAVARLADERIDWRFKGLPDALHGKTVTEAVASRPNLFSDGFIPPLVVLDHDAMEHNLATMRHWCESRGLALAPHGKTHMAPQLFQRHLDAGAWGLTCANASQLRVYRAFGVQRIMFGNELIDPAALRWLAAELSADPEFEFYCWADSVRGVQLMTEALRDAPLPVNVLVEVGIEGARAGARTVDDAEAVADAIVASPALRLAGVAGWEGGLAGNASEESLAIVDGFLDRVREVAIRLRSRISGQAIVTVGGSAFFDRVADALTAPWPAGMDVLPIIRSGAYLTHDDGLYRRNSPLGEHARIDGEPGFRSALRAWAQVTSTPQEGLALLTFGKRDAPFDIDLPVPQLRRRDGVTTELAGAKLTALNDQHAFLDTSAVDVQVGDWIAFGLSHPCTTFDKWQLLPEVGPDGETVVGLIRTHF
ncbi:amino acid deaminase [Pseudonocardiaceae bacterium YIM PH 21723]|nr:amino acid deaminase [Pseudonocardiaceae bacterium YIM PH 21723]